MEEGARKEDIEKLTEKLERLTVHLERMNLVAFLELIQEPKRLIFFNLLAGLSRGLGIALGATVVGTLFLYILGKLAQLNLPLIGDFIARIARMVQAQL
jgi:hypothetical protein